MTRCKRCCKRTLSGAKLSNDPHAIEPLDVNAHAEYFGRDQDPGQALEVQELVSGRLDLLRRQVARHQVDQQRPILAAGVHALLEEVVPIALSPSLVFDVNQQLVCTPYLL